jgi:hypothetical protein
MAIITQTFTDADLNGSYQFEFEHNLAKAIVVPTWYDDSGIQLGTASIFQMIDNNNCTLNCNNPITGTHTLVLEYDLATPIITGRRLFELGATTEPNDTKRLAFGEAGTPSINFAWSDVKSLLFNSLNFLKKEKNLSDVDPAASRISLSVYSQGQVNDLLEPKAELYQPGSGAVLGVSNTAVYTPATPNNPATKGYVDAVTEISLGTYGPGPAFTLNTSLQDINISVLNISIRKTGKMIIIHGALECSSASQTAFRRIANLTEWLPHGSLAYMSSAVWHPLPDTTVIYGAIQVNNAGELGFVCNTATVVGVTYYLFNLSYMTNE